MGELNTPSSNKIRHFVAANVKNGHPHFVALSGRKLIGWCDAIPGLASAGTAHIGSVGIGLLAEYRGLGIGYRLLEAVIIAARKKGLEKLELSVNAGNKRGIALYQRFGFEREGRRRRGYFADDAYDDVILMALFLEDPAQSE